MAYTILIVDDSSVTRMVLKKTIGMTGVDIGKFYEASNGEEGLESMKANSDIDLIVTDLNMPVMSGYEMLDVIIADLELSAVPILVISTEASTERIEELKCKGVKGYIHKPFSPEVVRDVLETVFELCSAC